MIKKFNDYRGDFVLFDANNCDQVNVVTNKRKFTFRGLHYQTNPPQTKMVKIIQGKVLDILYDLKTHKLEFYLLDKYSEPLYVADNYAHGYLTLEDNTIFTYAVKGEYNPESEHSIIWSDIMSLHDVIMSHVGTLGTLTISDKDSKGK
tara:strand:+ start:13608 stop:14051 length:444 start_codon:yes stop_codon:yes gene_type:complete